MCRARKSRAESDFPSDYAGGVGAAREKCTVLRASADLVATGEPPVATGNMPSGPLTYPPAAASLAPDLPPPAVPPGDLMNDRAVSAEPTRVRYGVLAW